MTHMVKSAKKSPFGSSWYLPVSLNLGQNIAGAYLHGFTGMNKVNT